jgi:Mn2+/Fe2+ NRAMP family transporter
VTEGLARWQLATGDTLLEGCVKHFGLAAQIPFLAYLLLWSFFIGAMEISAAGIAFHAMLPVFDANTGKIVFGILHSIIALALVELGGFRLFEKVMGACIAMMFVTVVVTAWLMAPDWGRVAAGLFVPTIPDWDGEGIVSTFILIGGIGGTVTVLVYGYWIREEGRQGPEFLRTCRIDLSVAYGLTAIFGIAMMIIGSTLEFDTDAGGAELLVVLADRLEVQVGAVGRWMFLLGAWGAIASSLLGVWQSIPYLFADFWNIWQAQRAARVANDEAGGPQPEVPLRDLAVDTKALPYRLYLYALAFIPLIGVFLSFQQIFRLYAVIGAFFMPMLALALLLLNTPKKWVGDRYRNSIVTVVLLVGTIIFFAVFSYFDVRQKLFN